MSSFNTNVKRKIKSCCHCNKEYINNSNNSKYCSSSCKYKGYRTGNTYKERNTIYVKSKNFKETQKKYRTSGKGQRKIKEIYTKYYPTYLIKSRIWRKTEKGKRSSNYHCALRYARKRDRTPKWLTKEDMDRIKEIYNNRPNGYEVDHIIPLCSKNVSGLHIPENLQYLRAEINRTKNNKFIV
jgi:hypothetical protein